MATRYRRMFASQTLAANLQIRLYDDLGNEVNSWNFARDRFSLTNSKAGLVRVRCDDLPEECNFWLEVQKVSDSTVVFSDYLYVPPATLTTEQRMEMVGWLQGHPILGERRVLVEPSATGYPSYPWVVNNAGPNGSPVLLYRDWDGTGGTVASNGGNGALFVVSGFTPTYPGTLIFDKANGSNGTNSQIQNYVAAKNPTNGVIRLVWTYYLTSEPTSHKVYMTATSNGGVTWSAASVCTIPNDFTAGDFANAPYWMGTFAGDNSLYMMVYGYKLNGGNNGGTQALWKSTNGGSTWTHVSYVHTPVGSYGLEETYLCQLSTGRILAVGGGEVHLEGVGIGYSDDSGVTWKNAAGSTVTALTRWPRYPMTNPTVFAFSSTRAVVFGRIGVGPTYPHTRWGVGYFIIDQTGTPITTMKLFDPAGYYFDCGYVAFAQHSFEATWRCIYYTDLFRQGIGLGAFGHPALVERDMDWLAVSGSNLTAQDVVSAMAAGSIETVTGNVEGNVLGTVGSLGTQAKADVNAEVAAGTARILGLSQDNSVLDDTFYDVDGNLTAATLYVYDTAAHATTHDGVTGLLYKWNLEATIVAGNLTLAKQLRVT